MRVAGVCLAKAGRGEGRERARIVLAVLPLPLLPSHHLSLSLSLSLITSIYLSPPIPHFQPQKAFAYFDKDFDGVLTADEVRSSVVAVFKERKNMAASLEDTDSIVRSLQFGIGAALHFVMGAMYLLV